MSDLQDVHARVLTWAANNPWARSLDWQDLAQDVLIQLETAAYRGKPSSERRSLAFRILQFKIANASGKLRRRPDHVELDNELVDPGPSPESRMLQREALRLLATAIGRLKPSYREVLRLRVLEGLNLTEIAAVLDSPRNTVDTRAQRCRRALRAELSAEG